MIPALGRFVEALRQEGVSASPAELVDAVRAVEAVGLSDRTRFRTALRSTLVKDRRQRQVFDRLFDHFFATPARGGEGRSRDAGRSGAGEKRGEGPGARDARRPRREEPPPARGPTPMGQPARSREEPRPRAAGDDVRALLSKVQTGKERRAGHLRVVRLGADRGVPRSQSPAEARLVHRDLTGAMPTEEERTMARLVPKLIEELRLRSGRRLRRSRRGRLWARKVFRENLAHGGIPFVLPFRRVRPRRPRVVLLVDVSFSVARAASFFVWMVSEFLRLGRDARVIAFVDRPVDATVPFSRWRERAATRPSPARPSLRPAPGEGIRRGGVSFPDLLRSLPRLNLDAPSDYGRAFHALLHSELRPTGKDTVLVILGDARTNRFDPLPWTLEEIRRRCRAVIWLVPEPAERWGTADSALAVYLPWVDVAVEANDLAGLRRGLAELLRKL